MAEYIDRQAALNIAEEECDGGTPYDIPMKLENLPAADVREREHGRWIPIDQKKDIFWYIQRWRCSACGCIQICVETNFCPNCGADMRGKKDG